MRQAGAELDVMADEKASVTKYKLGTKPLQPHPYQAVRHVQEHSASEDEIEGFQCAVLVTEATDIQVGTTKDNGALVQQPLRRQFILQRCHEGQCVALHAVVMAREQVPDEEETHTKSAASHL